MVTLGALETSWLQTMPRSGLPVGPPPAVSGGTHPLLLPGCLPGPLAGLPWGVSQPWMPLPLMHPSPLPVLVMPPE